MPSPHEVESLRTNARPARLTERLVSTYARTVRRHRRLFVRSTSGHEPHPLGRPTVLTPPGSSEGDSCRTWSPTRRYVASASATPLAKRYQPWSSPSHTST